MSTISSEDNDEANSAVAAIIDTLFQKANLSSTKTKAGWCLKQGLLHIASCSDDDDDGAMLRLIQRHGIPSFYSCCSTSTNPNSTLCRHDATQDIKDPSTCFESLCRIIAGQFISGVAAQAAWKKLLAVTNNNLTPETILALADDEQHAMETKLQKPAGITKAKARSIVDLAQHFVDGKLSEELFSDDSDKTNDDEAILRKALLSVRGIGPWSCDMFLQFYLEKPNILPLGDLGVRKGIAKHFGIRGSQARGQICAKKDENRVRERLAMYEPYHSLVTYYMWRVADTPSVMDNSENSTRSLPSKKRQQTKTVIPAAANDEVSTPKTKKRRINRKVTP